MLPLLLRAIFSERGTSKQYTPFIVLCSPRVGSTWFVDLLDSHPEICAHQEVYHPTNIFSRFKSGAEQAPKWIIKFRDRFPTLFLHTCVFKPSKSRIRALGFKVFYEHLTRIGPDGLLQTLKNDKNLLVIHLVRRNLLDVLISRKIARQVGAWNSLEKRYTTERVEVSPEESVSFFNKEISIQNSMRKNFASQRLLEISYEDLVSNCEQVMDRTLNFLGVSERELTSTFKKQELREKSEIIVNYPKLQKVLSGTEWRDFVYN